jgi:hypothetical protein
MTPPNKRAACKDGIPSWLSISTFITLGICAALPLLWFGVMFAVSLADPASAREITVHLADAPAVESSSASQSIAKFADSELVRNGFSRDQQTHDLDGTNWVTTYSYSWENYPPKTDVMASGCSVHQASNLVRIELWELGVLRPTQQFAKIRHELKAALIKKCGKGMVD